jgi:hypothetical protein
MQSLMGGKPQPFVLRHGAIQKVESIRRAGPDSFAVAPENLISHGEISREIVKYFTLALLFTPIFMHA